MINQTQWIQGGAVLGTKELQVIKLHNCLTLIMNKRKNLNNIKGTIHFVKRIGRYKKNENLENLYTSAIKYTMYTI